jgi:DNA repair exonuclease SbcCD nuclease subunit
MKIAILADTHWGARGDSPIFQNYFSRFFREIFFPYIDQNNIKTVVHLGDLVDRRKFLTYTTANMMRNEYINQSTFRKLETHIIAGNHDCSHKNNNEVNALREVVMGREGFTIYSNPEVANFNGMAALMLPWISPDNEEKSAIMVSGTKAKVCFAHLELVGFEMARGQMMEHGMDPSVFKKFKAVYTGHYHHKSSKGNIHYLGTPYEMTWADCDDPKGFHILDTDTMKLEFIRNPITLFQKVHFDGKHDIDAKDKIIKLIVGEGVDRKKLDKAIAAIDGDALDLQVIDEHLSIDDTGGQMITIDDAEDTMKIVTDYVMASEIDADKDALVGLMKQLYVEAQI